MDDVLTVVLWLLGIAAALAVAYVAVKNSIFIVQQGSVMVVKRWGKHHRVLNPGLHGRLPFADTKHRVFSSQRQSLPLELRGDSGGRLPVELAMELELRGVTDFESVMRVAYEIERPLQHLSTVATAAARQFLLPLTYDQILADSDLGTKLAAELADVAGECGYSIVGVRITSIRPERTVHDAIVTAERNTHIRADEAAQAEHDATMQVTRAKATANASAIEASADRNRLAEQATQVVALLAQMAAAKINGNDAAVILAALLHQQAVTTVGSNSNAQIILAPTGVTLPSDIAGITALAQTDAPAPVAS